MTRDDHCIVTVRSFGSTPRAGLTSGSGGLCPFGSGIDYTLPIAGDGYATVQKPEAEFAGVVAVGVGEPVSDEVGEYLRIDGVATGSS